MPRWRLLLVDDHALFREGLAGLFAYQEDFAVVGEAEDAACRRWPRSSAG
jgi:DNA-binding NarL/FixJ family response regulator